MENRPRESLIVATEQVELTSAAVETGIMIARRRWNNLKNKVEQLRFRESLWMTLMAMFFGLAVSFLVGAIGVSQPEDPSQLWQTVLIAFASFSLGGGLLSGIAYLRGRGDTERDKKDLIAEMVMLEGVSRDDYFYT